MDVSVKKQIRFSFTPLSIEYSFVIHFKVNFVSGDDNIDFVWLIIIIRDNMTQNRHSIHGKDWVFVVDAKNVGKKNKKTKTKLWYFPKGNLL